MAILKNLHVPLMIRARSDRINTELARIRRPNHMDHRNCQHGTGGDGMPGNRRGRIHRDAIPG